MSELEYLHQVLLSMYKMVRDICDRNDWKCFALGGTLLGAVRHGGFIPWDDDMDVALPRPDYDRFLKIAPRELPDGYELEHYDSLGSSLKYQCRVVKVGSEVEVAIGTEVERVRVFVDVFPLDAMPSNAFLRTIHKYRLLYARMKVQFSLIERVHHSRKRPLHERALMAFCEKTGMGSDWDTVELYRKAERLATKYDFDKEDWLVNYFGTYKFKEMFPKGWFGQGVELPFEGATITCPAEYDKVLTQMYGDYLQLPPEDQRSQQHKMTIKAL